MLISVQGENLRRSLLARYYERVPLESTWNGGRGECEAGSENMTQGNERKSLADVQVKLFFFFHVAC
jgi:hypothetical protein